MDPSFNGLVTLQMGYNLNDATLEGIVQERAVNGVAVFSGEQVSAPGTFDLLQVTAGSLWGETNFFNVVGPIGPPTVSGLVGSTGPVAGGTTVTISGSNFSGLTPPVVDFGTNQATILSVSPTQILAISPAGSPGTVDVTVTTSDGTSATSSADQFLYFGPPAAITTKTSSAQTATVGTSFGSSLQVLVTDTNGNPVSGASVTFTAPSSGATGSFSGASTAVAITDIHGLATAPTFTAGAQAGSFTVTASVPGVSTPASFNLTSTAALSVAATFNSTSFPNIPGGLVELAAFNESGGTNNPADYRATVAWGDGSSSSSTDSHPAVTITISGGQVIVSGQHTFTASGMAYPIVTVHPTYGSAIIAQWEYPLLDKRGRKFTLPQPPRPANCVSFRGRVNGYIPSSLCPSAPPRCPRRPTRSRSMSPPT